MMLSPSSLGFSPGLRDVSSDLFSAWPRIEPSGRISRVQTAGGRASKVCRTTGWEAMVVGFNLQVIEPRIAGQAKAPSAFAGFVCGEGPKNGN